MKVKICGFRRPENARAVADAGADWLGLNFAEKSKRMVDLETAQAIVTEVDSLAEPIALFVDQSVDCIKDITDRTGINLVQLHGNESPDLAVELANLGLRVVRAFRINASPSIDAMLGWIRQFGDLGGTLEAVLVDAFVPGISGGTGEAIPIRLLQVLNEKRADFSAPVILAGGLRPENVVERLQHFRPWMVDVASGVESEPGIKDLAKVHAFLRAARSIG